MDAEKELMGAATAVVVLAELQREPSYGYELLKRINAVGQGMFTWREGTLYPVLHRLELEGLLRGQWEDGAAGEGRKRKYYYITAKGRRRLAEGAAQWNAFYGLVSRLTGGSHGSAANAIA
jgi:DNA-binding PadR family transcriptional regulator